MINRFVACAARLAYRPINGCPMVGLLIYDNIGDFYLYWMRLRNL